MAELGIIASVVQIADTGLRLSIKLYTFGEIVATADKSVISISKDVSLTSSVLKELGSLLENDAESRIFSKNAVQTADTVVKECLEVFQEMESILVKKLPSLSGQDDIRGGGGGKKSKATTLLERMKWGYLQPKLRLLRSNLDRLKSTLLLMLNVITYARQVAGKSEPPSVIEDQRSLIEDLARSNQDYIHKFEQLKLGIQNTPRTQEDVQNGRTGCGIEMQREQDTQNHDHSKSMSPKRTATANVNINNMYINADVRSMSIPRGFEKTEQPRKAQELESEEDTLFSHLKHYLSLVNNLLDEVDEIKYEIRVDSRDQVRSDICQAYQREMKQLDTLHTNMRFEQAEQKLAPLVAGVKRRLEQIDGPDVGGQGTKRMSLGVFNGGAQQISQPQPDPAAMQLVLEGAKGSYSMPFSNDPSSPDLLGNFNSEQSLQSTDADDFILAEPLLKRSCKTPENIAHANDVINNPGQHNEEMEEPVAVEDQDTEMGPLDGHILMSRLQHGNLGASQQMLNADQQLQRNHPLPTQHQQSQRHLNNATPNATATAGSKPPAYQGPNDSFPTSAHYPSQYRGWDPAIPRESTDHPMLRLLQQPARGNSDYFTYIPLSRSGSLQRMAFPNNQRQQPQQHHATQEMALPNIQQQQAQQHRAAQQMALPNPQQPLAQLHHAEQHNAVAQQHLQRLLQNQQSQRQQQHANSSSDHQMYQARGNGQAEQSLSEARSIQGEPRSSLCRSQSADPRSPTTEELPQKKRQRPTEDLDERRFHGASAPITTYGSRPQARPLLGPPYCSAVESGNLSNTQVQSKRKGTSPTYDDPMQELEATVVGTPPRANFIGETRQSPTLEEATRDCRVCENLFKGSHSSISHLETNHPERKSHCPSSSALKQGTAKLPEYGSVEAKPERLHRNDDTYSNNSEAQAKANLAANQTATKKNVDHRVLVRSRRTRRLQQAPRRQNPSEGRDTRGDFPTDIVNDGAGYAGHGHYGSHESLPPDGHGCPDEVDGVGRPSPATRSLQRSNIVGEVSGHRPPANELRLERPSRIQYPDTSAARSVGLSSLEPISEPPRAPDSTRAPPIVQEAIMHHSHTNYGHGQVLKRSWQPQTPPLSSPLRFDGIGMEGELPKDKDSKFAKDDINTDLDIDLNLGLDYSPSTPYPSKPREDKEEDYFCKSIVPAAGNVVDELVTLWTLLPTG